ncbi:MAG: type II toxin-antitoxin system Phd/YefM family antitoxin [Brevundimonas sp.]|jgi:prevent-host-death family protein
MTIVTVHHAKTHLSKLIAAAERGEEVVIARGDKPAVRIVPFEPQFTTPAAPRFGALREEGRFDDSFFDALPEEELRLWEGRED